MAMNGYSVQFSGLAEAAQQIGMINRTVNDTLSSLEQQALTSSAHWTGQAKENYQLLKAQWDSGAANMNQLLAVMQQAVNASNEQLQGTESAVANMWRG